MSVRSVLHSMPPLGAKYLGWPNDNPNRSLNLTWRVGGHLVKSASYYTRAGRGGLAEAKVHLKREAKIAGALKWLGLPHLPYKYHEVHGVPLLTAPWLEGHRTLQGTDSRVLRSIDPTHAADAILGERLFNIGDRHNENYMVSPHGHVVPIDYGDTGDFEGSDLHETLKHVHDHYNDETKPSARAIRLLTHPGVQKVLTKHFGALPLLPLLHAHSTVGDYHDHDQGLPHDGASDSQRASGR